jgi:hypothetical protein
MSYNGLERRLKVFNLIERALESKTYFRQVKLQMPTAPPTATEVPSAYVALGSGTGEGFTNKEKDEELRAAVILFVRSEKDVDRVKLEALGKAEEVLMDLQTDADFEAVASLIDVDAYDAGPLALLSYGLDIQVLPPFGAIRLDVRVTFSYTAIN